MKLKMREMSEQVSQKDQELVALKSTLKFTKIKEFEAELALNVQESQRLRQLLERELTKPKADMQYVQSM